MEAGSAPRDNADVIDGITPVLGLGGGIPSVRGEDGSGGKQPGPRPQLLSLPVLRSERTVSEINGSAATAAGIPLPWTASLTKAWGSPGT